MTVRTFELQGFNELFDELKRFKYEVQLKMTNKSARAGAEVIRQAASNLAPTSDEGQGGKNPHPKGFLKRNIKISKAKTEDIDLTEYNIGPSRDAYWGLWVEKGHLIKRGKSGFSKRVVGHSPAHPFLRPALESNAENALQATAEVMKKEIDKYKAKSI